MQKQRNVDRTFWALGLSLLLLLLCAWVNYRVFANPLSPLTKNAFYTRKVHAAAAYDLVAIGNSRMVHALAPEVILEQVPDLRILNLGLQGACLTPQLFEEVESKLDPEAPSPMILLGVEPGTLNEYSGANIQLNVELGRSKEKVFLARHAGMWTHGLEPVRPYKVVNKVSIWLKGPTLGQPKQDNEFYPNGWCATYQEPETTPRVLSSLKRAAENTYGTELRTPLPFRSGLFRQVRDWTDKGILVFGVRIPVNSEIWEDEDSRFEFDMDAIARDFEASGGHWIPTSCEGYRSYDGSHLNKDEAIRFSGIVAKAIKTEVDRGNGH